MKFLNFFRNCFYGLKNLFFWMPIIWKDRNWDYIFLLEIIKFKLGSMQKDWHCSYNENWEKEYETMGRMIYLLDEIIKDDFCEKEMEEHYKQYGYLQMKCKEEKYNGCSVAEFGYSKPLSEEELKQANKENSKLYELEQERLSNAENEFFELFKNNYKKFWN